MKNIIKRIINLIILIAIAIGAFIFTKNIPNFLIAKENEINNNKNEIQTIEKVEETLATMPPGMAFEVNSSNFRKYEFVDGVYYTVDVPHISSQIYCGAKGLHMNPHGVSYEEVVSVVNTAKARMSSSSHRSCQNPRRSSI